MMQDILSIIVDVIGNMSGVRLSGHGVLQQILYEEPTHNTFSIEVQNSKIYNEIIGKLREAIYENMSYNPIYSVDESEESVDQTIFTLRYNGDFIGFIEVFIGKYVDKLPYQQLTLYHREVRLPTVDEILANCYYHIFYTGVDAALYVLYLYAYSDNYSVRNVVDYFLFKYSDLSTLKNQPLIKASQADYEMYSNAFGLNLPSWDVTVNNLWNFYNEISQNLSY